MSRGDVRLLNGSPHKKKTGKKPHVPIVTRWGNRRIKDIKRRDVRELLDEVAARAPIMADAALFRIRPLTAQRGGEVHGAAWLEFDLATLDVWGKRLDQIVSGKRSKVLAFAARA